MKENIFKKKILGRSGIGAIFCALVLIASMATAINVSQVLETTSDVDNLSYTFSFVEPNIQLTEIESQDFTTINMMGCLGIGKSAGEPMLPVKPITLLLPAMKEVSSVVVSGNPVEVELGNNNLIEKPVYPYQNPVPFGSAPGDFVKNDEVYSTDTLYPGNLEDDYHISYSRGYAIFDITLNPTQYNPVKGTVVYYPEMTVDIKLKDTSDPNPFFRNNPDDEAWVKKLICNPDITKTYTSDVPTFDYPGGLCDPEDDYDYVIVTTEDGGLDYWETSETTPYNWESLLDKHTEDDGFSCTLVTIQDIDDCNDYHDADPVDDLEARIREFSKDAYQDWGITYILIGGDDESIPAREMDTNYEKSIDSDIYWSNLDNNFNDDGDGLWGEEGDDGFDLLCELFIGRVTCDVPQDVSNWLTKCFYYADSMEDVYLDNTGFYGGDTGWSCQGDDFMDYSAIKGTDDWLGPNPDPDFPEWAGFQFGFETWNAENPDNQYEMAVMWTAEPPNEGWEGGSSSAAIAGFRNAINDDKVTVASGIAHANAQMSLDVYATSWEADYHNTKPFFLHDYGCHCGDMDAADDGVLHSMLFHSDTELAFGVVYNTCYGWGNFDCTNSSSAFQAKEFWAYFLDIENKSEDFGNWQFGRAHAFSKDRMAPTIDWDYSYGTWRAIIQGCLLFGDPAQLLKTPHPSAKPYKPDAPDGPDEWIQFIETTFTASTTDPEGEDLYYLLDWDDGNTSGWLGPFASGETAEGSHAWNELGDYEVRVRARDIWGAVSDWSDPHILTIVENKIPDRPTIEGPMFGFGGKEYEFTFVSNDPDNHDILYMVDWDDGDKTEWLGPFSSGGTLTLNHAWGKKGAYWVKAWAKDVMEGESEQGMFKISILTNDKAKTTPRSRGMFLNEFLENLIMNFPLLEQIFLNLM